MAALTPRKAEVERVVELMESEEFEDAKSTAKAIVKALYEEWRQRDWYAYAGKGGRPYLLYGLEPTENAAVKSGQKHGLDSDKLLIAHVHSHDKWQANWDKVEADANAKFDDHPCADCGHLEVHHGAWGSGRMTGKRIAIRKGVAPCMNECPCAEYRYSAGKEN